MQNKTTDGCIVTTCNQGGAFVGQETGRVFLIRKYGYDWWNAGSVGGRKETEAATDGWHIEDSPAREKYGHRIYDRYSQGVCKMTSGGDFHDRPHSEFIVHSRVDVPALLAHIEAVERERDAEHVLGVMRNAMRESAEKECDELRQQIEGKQQVINELIDAQQHCESTVACLRTKNADLENRLSNGVTDFRDRLVAAVRELGMKKLSTNVATLVAEFISTFPLAAEEDEKVSKFTELLVRTPNRDALDRTLQQLGGLVAETPEPNGLYIVRAFPPEGIGFLRFAIEHQGYAEVVGEREIGSNAEEPPQ